MPKLLLCGCIALVAVCLFPVTVWAQAHICDSQTTWAIDPPPVGQDPPHKTCCVHQFRAGEEIGWAASYVHEGTPSLANPLILNDWIKRLYEAAHAIQGANALCSERNLAWPGWYNMQDHLYRLAQQGIENCAPLRESPGMTCETFCMGAWVQLSGMLAGYGNVLGRMEADKPEQTIDESFSACDPNYFKLGFRLGYAHYRLQAGDRDAADTQVKEAIRHVQMLEDCRPWSGYCVNLWHPQLIKPNLYLLLDRNRLSTPDAIRKISDVMNEVDRTLIGGNRNLEISRCPGIDQILKVCGNRFWNGLSRASQRLASRPTVAVPPPPPPPTAPPSAPPSSPTAPTQPSPPLTGDQGKYIDIEGLRKTYLQKCIAMRNDYGKRYCEFVKNKSGCHLDPRGCWEHIITNALPRDGSQARISCGTRLLDNYRECLEGCNGEFATGAINIYTLIGRADDCANAAEGAVKACDAGAIDPPNKPTLAALPTSRLPESESSLRTGDPIAKISGTWEFGRVISATERQVICHLTLTRERVEKIGGYKISGNRHPNESFWGLEGENTIWFKHADGKITSKLTRREDDYWEGEYIEHKDAPVRGRKLNHYIKRVKK